MERLLLGDDLTRLGYKLGGVAERFPLVLEGFRGRGLEEAVGIAQGGVDAGEAPRGTTGCGSTKPPILLLDHL